MYKSEEIFTLLACSVSILICVSGASVNGLLFHMSVEEHHIVFHLPSISINRFCSSEFTQVHFNFERKGCSSFFDLFSFACANGCPLLCAHRWVTEWPVMRYADEDDTQLLKLVFQKETKETCEVCGPLQLVSKTFFFVLLQPQAHLYGCFGTQPHIRKYERRATSSSTFKSSLSHHVAWIIAFWYVLINSVKGVKNCLSLSVNYDICIGIVFSGLLNQGECT